MCPGSGHRMKNKIRECTSAECSKIQSFKFQNKVMICNITGKWVVYSLNSHNIEQRAQTDKHHGLTNQLKEVIETLLFEKNVKRPKKVMIDLIGWC